jgi:pimeloyl-ACP methyl ester carboxylesterase
VLEALGLEQVDVAGYSFGGGAGLRLAIQHPAVVHCLTIISAPYAQTGFFPEMLGPIR